MSIVAKSLKSERKKSLFKSDFSRLKEGGFNFNLLNLGVILFFVILSVGFALSVMREMNMKSQESNFPEIQTLQKRFNSGVDQLKMTIQQDSESEMKFLVSVRDTKKLYTIAEKNQNVTYLGIYYYLKGQYQKAEELLRMSFSKNRQDVVSGTYLADIYYRQGEVQLALNVLSALNQKDFKVLYNTAVAYETLKDYRMASTFYRKSLEYVNQSLMEYRIMVKLFVLKTMMGGGAV